MAYTKNNGIGILRSLDWWTIIIYLLLLAFGWMSVCGASYSFEDTDLLSLSSRSGMQIVWIGTSICLGFIILMMDDRFFDTFGFVIYIALLLLLFATIFNPHEIKGSRSWLVQSATPAARRVCQVRHGSCRSEINVGIWLYPQPHSRLLSRVHDCHHSYAAHYRSERNWLGTRLSQFLPDVLS